MVRKEKRRTTRTSKPGSRWQVRRPDQCALLDLKSFRQVAQSHGRAPQPQPQQQPQRGQHFAAQTSSQQQVAPTVTQLPLSGSIAVVLSPMDEANRSLGALTSLVTTWQTADNAARSHTGSARSLREAAAAGYAANMASNKLSAEIHALSKLQGVDATSLHTLRKGWMFQTLQCCLPGLDAKASGADELVASLIQLDAKFAHACAPGGYRLDRLLALIANHGRIREFGCDKKVMHDAIAGMRALADTMLDALGEGLDGMELDGFYGLDSALDPALQAVRLRATTDAMLLGAARANGCPVDQLAVGDVVEAERDAEFLVTKEQEIARTKQRIRRALEANGNGGALSSLSGIRVDAELVRALRDSRDRKLRLTGKEIGVILAALMAMQRELAESPAAQRRIRGMRLDPANAARHERRAEGLRQKTSATTHRGLAEKELVALGVSRKDAAAACKTLSDWADRGISSADQVEGALQRFNRVQGLIGKQNAAFKRSLNALDSGPQTGRARQLGDVLVRRLAGRDDLFVKDVVADANKVRDHVNSNVSLGLYPLSAFADDANAAFAALGESYSNEADTLVSLDTRNAVGRKGIGVTARLLDARIADRRKAMGEDKAKLLDTAILAATIAHLGDTPIESFRPGDHAAKIIDSLREWRLPVDAFLPEIQHALSQTFGPAELNDWVKRLDIRREEVKFAKSGARGLASAQIRSRLHDALENLNDDSKLRITFGRRFDAQSGSIPLDPAGLWSLNTKVSAGAFAGIEISQNFGAYELIVRDGTEGKAGLDASMKFWAASAVGAKASVTFSAEGGGGNSKGMVVRYPVTPQGRDAMRALVERMVSGKAIKPKHFAGSTNMRDAKEWKVQGKVAVTGKLGMDVGLSSVGGDVGKYAGAGASVSLQAAAWGQYAITRSANTNVSYVKRTRTVGLDLTASAAIGVRGSAPMPGGGSWSTGIDVFDAAASLQWEYKDIDLPTYLGDGLLSKNTCRSSQMVAPAGPLKQAAVQAMGGNALGKLLAQLDASREEADQRKAAEVRRIIDSAGVNDVVHIRRLIDPAVYACANDLIAQAQALRAGRMVAADAKARARELDKQVQMLLDDEHNYYVERLQVFAIRETMESSVAVNVGVLKVGSYAEDHGEFAKEELKFAPPQ